VFSELLGLFENEAQLALVLSHEVAHLTEDHAYRQTQYHKKKLMALEIGIEVAAAFGKYDLARAGVMVERLVRNGYSRSLENQADRVGMEYAVAAGYDPREGPRIWKLMAGRVGNHRTNVFVDTHDSPSTRRSYLMAELRNNYSDLDTTSLTTNESTFQSIA